MSYFVFYCYLFLSCSRSITSVGEDKANFIELKSNRFYEFKMNPTFIQ